MKQQEREQNKILADLPEWQEYKRESRQHSKKAKHNKEFFKKLPENKAKYNYKQHKVSPVIETAEKRTLWQCFMDWLRK